jgi:hypothetical protein
MMGLGGVFVYIHHMFDDGQKEEPPFWLWFPIFMIIMWGVVLLFIRILTNGNI